MKKLIINTANEELFIVLNKDNEIFSKTISSSMRHNETMLLEIDKILNENEVKIDEIDEFGVVVGPGSFTGIRVGISTTKAFRDSLGAKAKGVNNLDYLFALASSVNSEIETVAINGSRDSYFVAKLIHGIVYKYPHNLTLKELIEVAGNKPVGMFKQDENLNCFVVKQDAKILLSCENLSEDMSLVPVYYQLSQAENEKLKRSNVEIKLATEKDVDSIAELEKENILVNTMSKKQIKSSLDDENYIVFKAVADGEVVGFIMLNKSDELNIDSVAVKKEFRNLGIATKLIERAEAYAKESGVGAVSLEVAYKNITAYLLYKKLGFVERRTRKNYYQNGDDAIEMVKKFKRATRVFTYMGK